MSEIWRGKISGWFSLFVLTSFYLCWASFCGESHAFEDVDYVRGIRAGLQKPVDIAVSISGDLYILDEDSSRVYIFDPAGKIKSDFGEKGSKPGQLDEPKSIALTPGGNIVIADIGDNSVKVFGKRGEQLFKFGGYGSSPGKFSSPSAVDIDQFGFIFVADKGNKRIQVFTSRGIFNYAFPVNSDPIDLGIDMERNLYILMPKIGRIVKYSPEGRKIKEIRCTMNGRNYLPHGAGITVDFRGDIYITENEESSIKKVDENEKILLSFGSEGEGRGQFEGLVGIASDGSGKIYVADSKNKRVQVFQVSGSLKTPMQQKLKSPALVELDSAVKAEKSIVDLKYVDGVGLYALIDKKSHILIKGPPHKLFGKPGKNPGEFKKPGAFNVSSDGTMFVADTGNHRLQVLSSDGEPSYHFGKKGSRTGQFRAPQGVAVNSKGNIFVSDTSNNRIQIFNSDGIFLSTFGKKSEKKKGSSPVNGSFLSPGAISIDSKDRVYILDRGNNRIQVFNEEGKHLKTIGEKGPGFGQFEEAVDIVIDENDFLYVAEKGNSRVQVFGPDGEYVMAFGSSGDGAGSFRKISAIAARAGIIYVGDYENDFVQTFKFYPQGLEKEDLIYVTKTAYPPHDHQGSNDEKISIAKKVAIEKAVRELSKKLGLEEDRLKELVKVESEERLDSGEMKVTVSIPKNIKVRGELPPTKKEAEKKQEYELK